MLFKNNFSHQRHHFIILARDVAGIFDSYAFTIFLITFLVILSKHFKICSFLERILIIFVHVEDLSSHFLAQCHSFKMVQLRKELESILVFDICGRFAIIFRPKEVFNELFVINCVTKVCSTQFVCVLVVYVTQLKLAKRHSMFYLVDS